MVLAVTSITVVVNFIILCLLFGWMGIPIYFGITALSILFFYLVALGEEKMLKKELVLLSAVVWPLSLPFYTYWWFFDRKKRK